MLPHYSLLSGLCTIQFGVFILVSGLNEFAYRPIESTFSIPGASIVFLVFSVGFRSQVFGGLVSSEQDQGVGSLLTGLWWLGRGFLESPSLCFLCFLLSSWP